jgi:hypothetical protein
MHFSPYFEILTKELFLGMVPIAMLLKSHQNFPTFLMNKYSELNSFTPLLGMGFWEASSFNSPVASPKT